MSALYNEEQFESKMLVMLERFSWQSAYKIYCDRFIVLYLTLEVTTLGAMKKSYFIDQFS